MSLVATAGAAAWVVPEILTAKPAAGATLSGPAAPPGTTGSGGGTPGQSAGGTPGESGVSTAATATQPAGPTTVVSAVPSTQTSGPPSGVSAVPSTQLAYSGLDIERDALVGASLIAGGWAIHHWASRTQEERPTA